MRELRIVNAMELAAAYAAADYAVVMDGDALHLRVGEQALDLEAYWPARRYAFITAWNPASVPHSEASNDAANTALMARLDAAGLTRQPAQAFDLEGEWREAGWLVFDASEHLLEQLAQEFGQAGVLFWEAGEPVRLRMMFPAPPRAVEMAHVDWLENRPVRDGEPA
ncbi:DUF3293 domain-containing protein [Lysobacter fragariae]